jgi:hypothetical protein
MYLNGSQHDFFGQSPGYHYVLSRECEYASMVLNPALSADASDRAYRETESLNTSQWLTT